MVNIEARFSNDTVDVYKGHRAVTAAWAIVSRATGAILLSGHSLDRVKASKTADGKLQSLRFVNLGLPMDHPLRYFEGADWRDTVKQKRAKRAHNEDRLALIRSLVTIEIVNV